jgi:stage II sporulation SpoE-like protein
MRSLLRIVMALLALFPCLAVKAQFADVSRWTNGYTTIGAAWRFQTGDDPRWATPNFDDSQWPLLRLDRGRGEQGYRNYAGYAWYRIKLKLPASTDPLALGLDRVANSEEVYVDGQLISTLGQMRPAPAWRSHLQTSDVVPLPPVFNGKIIELALRTWESPLAAPSAGAGVAELPQLGTLQAIRQSHSYSLFQAFVALGGTWLVDVVAAVIGLFSLGLFLLRPGATEYAWAALWLFGWMLIDSFSIYRQINQFSASHGALVIVSLQACQLVCWLLFIWGFVRTKPDHLLAAGIALALLSPFAVWLASEGAISVADSYVTRAAQSLILGILVFVRLVRLAGRGNRDAQMFLAPFLFYSMIRAIDQVLGARFYMGALKAPSGPVSALRFPGGLVLFHTAAGNLDWYNVFTLLCCLAVAAVLVLRFARSAEEEQRLSTEMESARQVQALLVPTRFPITPNYRFEAAYVAASEVGGDFYQVQPQRDGTLLIMVGDVSGKGLKAAMHGTLIVGAFRALAQEEFSPVKILSRLNLQLAASSGESIATCLVLHLTPEGRGIFANAGHLAPYCNGKEIPCSSGLPLGLMPDNEYIESILQLAPGDTLTLLSDGVVEARNHAGELFGFERTRAISGETAKTIAETAQSFGQEDDITVLTVTMKPATVTSE